ncbi:MAG TPA: 1-acyl-sn-glycerol-3-phosphate acyltransferase [Dehalococcoidia bacterium]|nr:1-acyl-sn-glycerol-3-phosphate acyltransferase [Dehalococcoidia bacterium]
MGRYIVLTTMTGKGKRALTTDGGQVPAMADELAAFGGKVIEQYALLGEHDFCTIIEAPDNAAVQSLSIAERGADAVQREVMPAIDLPLFARLLTQTTETVGPFRWQTSWWARLVRPALHWWELDRDAKKQFKPLRIIGRNNLKGFRGPAIIVANHSSHLDSSALYLALPRRIRAKAAWGAAADRWFLKDRPWRKSGWWNSLTMNGFPIKRGGGRASLAYAEELIDEGWSITIFPEGTRTTTGKLGRFRVGPALLALGKNVPVIPVYMHGLREIRPKGSKEMTPGPVTVHIGKPLYFAPGTDASEATHVMYKAVEHLRDRVRAVHGNGRTAAPASAGVAQSMDGRA